MTDGENECLVGRCARPILTRCATGYIPHQHALTTFFSHQPTTPGVALPLPSACPDGPPIMRVTGHAPVPGVPDAAGGTARGVRPTAAPAGPRAPVIPPRPIPTIDGPGGSGSARRRIIRTQLNGDVMGQAIFICGFPCRRLLMRPDAAGNSQTTRRPAAIGGALSGFPALRFRPRRSGVPPGGRPAWLTRLARLVGFHGRWAGLSPCSGPAVPRGHGLAASGATTGPLTSLTPLRRARAARRAPLSSRSALFDGGMADAMQRSKARNPGAISGGLISPGSIRRAGQRC